MAKQQKKARHTIPHRAVDSNAAGIHPPDVSDRALDIAALVLLAVVLVAVYAQVTDAPLVYDDELAIQDNVSIRQLWPLFGDAQHPGPLNPDKQLPTAGRPLVNLTLALNYRAGGLNPTGYRVVNLAIHYSSALLLMLVVRRTLRLPFFADRFQTSAGPLALLVALLWAVHPLQTECIAYNTQRTELLAGFFYLATLYSAICYWSSFLSSSEPGRLRPRSSRTLWLALAVAACAAGMASKEVMVSAPLVVLLYEWTFLSRSPRDIARKSWPLYAGLTATWLLLLALNIDNPRSNSAGFHLGVSPFVWWATQAKVIWMYFKLAVWPWPLVVHYELPYLSTWNLAAPCVALTAAFVAVALFLLWKRNAAGFVFCSTLVILAPTSIVPIVSEVAAERRMYLPLAGLLALAVVGVYVVLQHVTAQTSELPRGQRTPLAWTTLLAALFAIAASVVSARRLTAYDDTVTLWRDVLVHQPQNYVATYNLASHFYAANQPVDALPYFERGVELRPNDLRARYSYAQTLERLGRDSDAVTQYELVVRNNPDYFPAYADLAQLYVRTKQSEKAVAAAEHAVRLARSAGRSDLAEQIESWLAAYRSRPPATANSADSPPVQTSAP